MTIDVDVETLIANHLDGEVLDGVTLTLDSNLFAGPLRPAGTQDDEGATLTSVYVHRRGGAGSDRVDWFSGQGGSDVTTTVAVIVRGDPGEYDEHEALCRAVVEYLHLNPPAATSIIDVICTTPYTPAQRSDTGSGVAPLTELLFSVRYITDGSASSIPSPNAPAGGDLDGEYLNPDVVAVHAGGSSGTRLTIGAISDGQYLKRVGTTIAGVILEAVPASRTISTTAPLQGGGDLSADRTLSLADSGASAGSYGSSSAIPVLTVSAKGLITSISTAAINTTSLGAVPTTRTLTGTAPITVGGVSGTPQDLSADRTIALADAGITAGSYGPICNFTATAKGILSSAKNILNYIFDDLTVNPATTVPGYVSVSGTVAASAASAPNMGIWQIGINNATSLLVYGYSAAANMPFIAGGGTTLHWQMLGITSNPASPTSTNSMYWGMVDSGSGTPARPANGFYFSIDTAVSSSIIQAGCANSSSRTLVSTGVNIAMLNFALFEIIVASDGLSAQFLIDGVVVATISTNVPTVALNARWAAINLGAINTYLLRFDWWRVMRY